VGDQNEGDAEIALQGLQFELHLAAQLAVKGGKRFVEQQNPGIVDKGARERDALLLSAGHFPDAAFLVTAEAYQFQGAVDRTRNLGSGQLRALLFQAVGDIAGHIEVRKQGIVLEDHVHRALVGRHRVDRHAFQPDFAVAWLFEAGNHAQSRCLAAARRAEKGQEFPGQDAQVDGVGGDHIAIPFRDIAEFNDGGRDRSWGGCFRQKQFLLMGCPRTCAI